MRSLVGPLIMSLEGGVLTLMATAGAQADFSRSWHCTTLLCYAGVAGVAGVGTAALLCRRGKSDLNWAAHRHITAHCKKHRKKKKHLNPLETHLKSTQADLRN